MSHRFLGYLLAFLSGAGIFLLTEIFISILDYAEALREKNRILILFAPVALALIIFLLKKYSRETSNHILFSEMQRGRAHFTLHYAPLMFLMMILSILTGASVGREGLLVQILASMAVVFCQPFPLTERQKKALLFSSAAVAFGTVTQVVWVGCVFVVEVLEIYRPRFEYLVEILFGILGAECVSRFLSTSASAMPSFEMSLEKVSHLILGAIFVGVFCGILARLFIKGIHVFEGVFSKVLLGKFAMRAVLVVAVSALAFMYHTSPFIGLGYAHIPSAFEMESSIWMAPLKIFWSALSLGLGFKGGEFVPSVFAGSFAGNAIAQFMGVSPYIFAALGYAALFGAAANIPVTATLLACGLFGFKIFPFAAITNAVAFFVSGPVSIFGAQGGLHRKKNIFAKIF